MKYEWGENKMRRVKRFSPQEGCNFLDKWRKEPISYGFGPQYGEHPVRKSYSERFAERKDIVSVRVFMEDEKPVWAAFEVLGFSEGEDCFEYENLKGRMRDEPISEGMIKIFQMNGIDIIKRDKRFRK